MTTVAISASILLPSRRALACQTATLVVSEAKPPVAELRTQDSVLLAQILNRVLLLLIHPSRDRNKQKSERVQRLRHRSSRLPSQHALASAAAISTLFPADPGFGYYAVMIVVDSFGGQIDAEMAKSALQSAGIES